MRSGNVFSMHSTDPNLGDDKISVPYEVLNAFDEHAYVIWHDNQDGTFTLMLMDKRDA